MSPPPTESISSVEVARRSTPRSVPTRSWLWSRPTCVGWVATCGRWSTADRGLRSRSMPRAERARAPTPTGSGRRATSTCLRTATSRQSRCRPPSTVGWHFTNGSVVSRSVRSWPRQRGWPRRVSPLLLCWRDLRRGSKGWRATPIFRPGYGRVIGSPGPARLGPSAPSPPMAETVSSAASSARGSSLWGTASTPSRI